jgi:glycine dehydrogenase subunit 1
MRYIPSSLEERKALLDAVGVSSVDDLFATVPREVYRKSIPGLPPPASEIEVRRELGALAATCAQPGAGWSSFLGAGLYAHHVPAFVWQLLLRGELLTAYTPYQPEVSQGTLAAIWEFQSHVALLTEMDVANASMYEGASATVEAVLMAERLTKGRTKVVLSEGLHPDYRRTLVTYLANFRLTLVDVPLDASGATDAAALAAAVDATTICAVVQSPNVFGVVEPWEPVAEAAHGKGALAVAAVNEMLSLALRKGPGACGMDIAAGEAASFGVPPSFGGPLVGFLACRDAMKRQIPGRLAGRTVDADGRPAFCLTLATREQHIRREKATSNICTNQGLLAMAATMTLDALGKHGVREMAVQCLSKAEYLKARVKARAPRFALAYSGPTFDEVAFRCPVGVDALLARAEEQKILAGVPYSRLAPGDAARRDVLLVAVTEKTTRGEIDALVSVMEGF